MNTSSQSYRNYIVRHGSTWRIAFFVFVAAASLVTFTDLRVAAQAAITLPAGKDGDPYKDYRFRFTSGVAPITWSITSGQLPPGLSLNATTGVLSGTPEPDAGVPRPHDYQFTVQAVDSSAAQTTAAQLVSLKILAASPKQLIFAEQVPEPTPIFKFTSSSNNEESIALDQVSQKIDGVDQDNLCIGRPKAGDLTPDDVAKGAQKIVESTLGPVENGKFQAGDYLVIDLVKWKDAAASKSDKEKETVALFERVGGDWKPHFDPQDKENNLCKRSYDTRIFGSKRVTILPIHFNTPTTWDLKYTVSVTQTTPTPIADALALASNLSGAAPLNAGAEPSTKTAWGAKLMMIKYHASEILVKLSAIPTQSGGAPAEQSKESSLKFVNEGKYHWDVSVGLPVKTLRELTFVSDATNGNRISASAKERQDVYGFFNFFPVKVDLKGDHWLTAPHFLFGVPLASKPLHRPIAGIGTGMYKGPVKFNIFAGVVFIRERVPTALSVGQTASQTQLDNDLHTRWVRKFTFGINFPVSQITSAIKSKK